MRKGSKYTPLQLTKIRIANIKSGILRRGKPLTAEHKKNLRKANKGQIPWIKGKRQCPEHIQKRIHSRIKNGTTQKLTAPRGAKHYLWIKNRALLKDDSHERGGQLHREWSRKVKSRDDWKCRISDQNCKGKIEAHHILGWTEFPGLRYKLNNGITLCHSHHPRKRNDEKKMSLYFKSLNDEYSILP